MNAQFLLSKSEEKKLISKAKKGDSEAALKLYLYYEAGQFDQLEAFFWLRTAAGLKNPKAEYSLALYYAEDRPINIFHLSSAKMWLARAQKDGSPEAEKKLKELEAKEKK